MTLLEILKIVAAILTILTGLISLLLPRRITGFIGLEPVGGRGVSELRAIFGAAFVALGAYPLFAGGPDAYRMLGVMYLAIAAVRAVAIIIDRSPTRSNLISLATEIPLGIVLVW